MTPTYLSRLISQRRPWLTEAGQTVAQGPSKPTKQLPALHCRSHALRYFATVLSTCPMVRIM